MSLIWYYLVTVAFVAAIVLNSITPSSSFFAPHVSRFQTQKRSFDVASRLKATGSDGDRVASLPMEKILFVEAGFGCDQHGQDSTKAAVRACRNAIEFNSIPCIRSIVPGGRENMILRVQIAVPFPETVDEEAIKKVFPYGKFLPIEISRGGMLASSGIALPELGDKNDMMHIAVAVITIGY
jgi:uncharacterized protein (TIGR02058 family)